jgi:hypothetical protein
LIALARSEKGSRLLFIRGIDPISGSTRDLDATTPSGAGEFRIGAPDVDMS